MFDKYTYKNHTCNTRMNTYIQEKDMLAVRLSKNLENRLSIIAQKTGRTKTYYVTKALEEFLEDREDYLLALQRLEENNPRIGLEQARKLLEDIEQNTSANKA